MIQIYEVCGHFFTSRAVAVRSVRLSYKNLAKVTPNVELSRCTVVFDDGRPNEVVEVKTQFLRDEVTHL